ncbi:MAG: hypothetical protein JRJ44_01600 [Deltaproteobacteria bacterium]|nr:hypothetical protein [Deltaproteobacteria bacterium]
MNPLVESLIGILKRHSAVQSIRIVNYDETPAGKLELKIRCSLVKNYKMQIWLHHEPKFQDYAYQLFTDHPILRWDNAPHYPDIATAPRHFHDASNNVSESYLTGTAQKDLKKVL